MSNTECDISLLNQHPFSTPLKRRFAGEFYDQRAYIYVSLSGNGTALISATYSALVGGAYTSESFYGFERQFRIPNTLRTHEINSLIRSLAPLAARMGRGASVALDGMSNRRIVLDEDAAAASDELDRSLSHFFEYGY